MMYRIKLQQRDLNSITRYDIYEPQDDAQNSAELILVLGLQFGRDSDCGDRPACPLGGTAMAFSSVSVVLNALRLQRVKI